MARRKGCGLKQPKGYPKPPRTPRQPKIKKTKVPAGLKAPKEPNRPKMNSHEKLYTAEARKRNNASNTSTRNTTNHDTDDINLDGLIGCGQIFLLLIVLSFVIEIIKSLS